MAMANMKMVLYTAYDGIETRMAWDNEESYRLVKQFLEDMGIDITPIKSGGMPTDAEFAYMETEQQYDALCDFTRALKDEGKV